jgi:hypothetical protein
MQARLDQLGDSELMEALENEFRPFLSDPEIRELRFEHNADTCRAVLVLAGQKALAADDDLFAFDPSLFSLPELPEVSQSRGLPLRLGDPVLAQARVEWTLPEGWIAETSGTIAESATDGARYAQRCILTEGRANWEWACELEGVLAPVQRVEEIRSFVDQVRAANQVPLLMRRVLAP